MKIIQRPFSSLLKASLVAISCWASLSAQETTDPIAILQEAPGYGVFTTALQETEWGEFLETNPFTIFVPSDEAFADFFIRVGMTRETLFANQARLRSLISFHILSEAYSLAELQSFSSVMPERRSSLPLGFLDDEWLLNGEARVLQGDQQVGSGWLHYVDTVLLAPGEFAIADAENAEYLNLGVGAVILISVVYLASLYWRFRVLRAEGAVLRRRLNENDKQG